MELKLNHYIINIIEALRAKACKSHESLKLQVSGRNPSSVVPGLGPCPSINLSAYRSMNDEIIVYVYV